MAPRLTTASTARLGPSRAVMKPAIVETEAAVLHELAEQGAQEEQREELPDEARRRP